MKRFGEDGAGQLAALIAYFGFFSLFPLLLVATTILGYFLADDPQLRTQILDSALSQFPIIGTQIRNNLGTISGSGVALAVGIGAALWAGLGGVRAAQSAMDAVWDVPYRERPGFPKALARSAVMLVTLGAFIVLSAVLAGAAGTGEPPIGIRIASILGAGLLNIAVFAAAFRILTVAPVGWKDVLPGAVLAGVAWTGLSVFGGWIVDNRVRSASETYGFFAIVIGLLAWIYLGAQVAMLAAEVNVVRVRRLWPRALHPSGVTEADERALRGLAKVEERRKEETVSVEFEATEPAEGDATPESQQAGGRNGRRSIGELGRSVLDGLQTLLRKEIELAKLELVESASARIRGAVMFVAVAVLGLFALGYLAAAGAAGLDNVMPAWASRLIVAGVFLLAAGIALLVARRSMQEPGLGPKRTKETLKEDAEWARTQIKR